MWAKTPLDLRTESGNQDTGIQLPLWFLLLEIHTESPASPTNSNCVLLLDQNKTIKST